MILIRVTGWRRLAITMGLSIFAPTVLGAPPTPDDVDDHTWEMDAGPTPGAVGGHAADYAAAVTAMRAAGSTSAASFLQFAGMVRSTNYVTETYLPRPSVVDPVELGGFEFVAVSGCAFIPGCNSWQTSVQNWRNTIESYILQTANFCGLIMADEGPWDTPPPWAFNGYSGIDLDDPRSYHAFRDETIHYAIMTDIDGPEPEHQLNCNVPAPQEKSFNLQAFRPLTCPGGHGGDTGWTRQDAIAPNANSPYQNCLNTTEGQIRYFTRHERGECADTVGNPCDVATGAKTETVVDYAGPTLHLQRTYTSMPFYENKSYGPLGYGWRHNFERALIMNSAGTVPESLIRNDGSLAGLTGVSGQSNTYIATNGSGIQVKQMSQTAPGGNYPLTTNWTVFLPSGDIEVYQFYDCAAPCQDVWHLREIKNVSGQAWVLNYASGANELSEVVGPFGHKLTFAYSQPPACVPADEDCVARLDYVTGPAGASQKIEYYYGGSASQWGERLSRVDYPDGGYDSYGYDAVWSAALHGRRAYRLTSITDGRSVLYANYAYWPDGRAKSTEHVGGIGKFTLTFDSTSFSTRVEDAATVETTYAFTGNNGGLRRTSRIDYADGSNRQLTYYSSGRRGLENEYIEKLVSGSLVAVDHRHNVYAGTYPFQKSDEYEAYGTTDERRTRYVYLNSTSDLPRFVRRPGAVAGQWKQTEFQYCAPVTASCPSGQLVAQRTESTVNGSWVPISGAPSRTWTFSYNAAGDLETIDGPRNDVSDLTTLDYWDESSPGVACATTAGGACGQIKSISNAAGHATTFDEYDAAGRLKEFTDPNGMTTTYTYDARGRISTITEVPVSGASRVTDYDYDGAGQLDKVTLPNGQYLDFVWSDARLLDYVTDNLGHKLDYTYDTRGNRTGEDLRDAGGTLRKALQMAYDVRNRVDTMQLGARPAADIDIDASGVMQFAADSGGRSTTYGYDALNRLVTIWDPENGLSAPTVVGYDAGDNVTAVEAPNGALTTFVHDDLGNRRSENSPDRGLTLYGYDAAGNMTCKADGRYTGSATTCETVSGRWTYTYDALNRVTSIDYTSTPTISTDIAFTWDSRDSSTQNGRLRQVTYDQLGITVTRKMDYDSWGNVTWSQQVIQDGGATKMLTTAYEYDGNNQLKKITYPSGRIIEYVRAANGRISGITSTFNSTTTDVVTGVQYYPFGPPSGYWYGNGLAHAMVRDTAYSPIWMRLFSSPPLQYFDSRTYDIDDAGDVTAIDDLIDSGNSRDFGYDDLSRLTWDSRVTATAPTYAYDPNGNRLSRTATSAGFFDQDLTYDADSNVVATYAVGGGSPVPVIHDGMGNVTDNGAGLLFAYDDGGRLNSIWQNATVTGLLTLYNGMGELARTRKVTYDPCTNAEILLMMEYFGFAPDGRALHLRSENYSRTETDWVWLDGEPVAQFQDSYDGQGVYQGTTVTYLHTDHLGTPRVGTDDGQQVTWRLETDAFGIGAPAGPAVVRLRMPGQVAFGLGGVDYNYFRDYWAQWGRYVESDPIGLDGGLNTYAYAASLPTGLSDPLGLDVTVQYFPGRQGHVGIGVNSPQTVGLYPRRQSLAVAFCGDTPGEVVPDAARQTSLALKRAYSFTIKTSAAQDLLIQQYLDRAQANRNTTYNLCNNQCADFVRGALTAGGIPIPESALKTVGPLPIPLDFFSNLRTGLEQR